MKIVSEIFNAVANIFGGVDVTDSLGSPEFQTRPNLQGGIDYFQNGTIIEHTTPNIYGGLDHFNTQGTLLHTEHANLHGGVDLIDPMGSTFGHANPNIHGGLNISNAQNVLETQVTPTPSGFHARFFK